ncbi:MAG: hypothetical protein SWK76_17105 [Actinomycetota bacterium]|nr:hypothetical protein [Actinomycetota bacterium]
MDTLKRARRRQMAVTACIILLVAIAVTSFSLAEIARRHESERAELGERAEQQKLECTQAWEALQTLLEWIEETRLKYGVDDDLPEEIESTPAVEEESGVPPPGPEQPAFTAAGTTSTGFNWRETMAYIQSPDWEYSDSVEEYIAVAFFYSSEVEGDPSGKSSHLWETGQALRNGWHTSPMSDGYRQATQYLYAATCIDDLLASRGSPLAGYGIHFVLEAEARGVSPYLLAALTAAESTFATNGNLSSENHNAWGMMGPNEFTRTSAVDVQGGACWWPDWPSAISGAAAFLDYFWPDARTAYNCRSYCEGNPSDWFQTVEHFRAILESLGGEL